MKLVYEATRVPVQVGDIVSTFRGAKVKVTGMTPPAHSVSTGRVHVREPIHRFDTYYFPSVIDAKWVE